MEIIEINDGIPNYRELRKGQEKDIAHLHTYQLRRILLLSRDKQNTLYDYEKQRD